MKKPVSISIFLLLVFPCLLKGQASFSSEMKFLDHLNSIKAYNDALLLLHQLKPFASAPESDSINYYLAWNHLNLKQTDSASYYFNMIHPNSGLYNRSAFYNSFSLLHQKKTKDALQTVSKIFSSDSLERSLQNLFLAGTSLLQRDYTLFDSCSGHFTLRYYALSEEEKSMRIHRQSLERAGKKSPALAGILSGFIPGAGKFYTGRKGEGIAAFLEVGILGASAIESYVRSGPESGRFIVLGSLFTVFYIGNIWGSVLSVKLNEKATYEKTDQQILLDLRIPLRRIFE